MVRYLVEAGNGSRAYFSTLKEARRYAYNHTSSDSRSYIYTGPNADDRLVGTVFKYDYVMYWKGKKWTYFLISDGSLRPLATKRTATSKTNDFGLNWNLK